MSGEVWQAPKTNWAVGEAIPTTYFNRIESCLSVLHRGGGQAVLTTAVSANSIVLPNETDSVFKVSGSVQIYFIDTTNRQPGNTVSLLSQDGFTIAHAAPGTAPSGFAKVMNATLTAVTVPQYGAVDLVYDGTYWYLKAINMA